MTTRSQLSCRSTKPSKPARRAADQRAVQVRLSYHISYHFVIAVNQHVVIQEPLIALQKVKRLLLGRKTGMPHPPSLARAPRTRAMPARAVASPLAVRRPSQMLAKAQPPRKQRRRNRNEHIIILSLLKYYLLTIWNVIEIVKVVAIWWFCMANENLLNRTR